MDELIAKVLEAQFAFGLDLKCLLKPNLNLFRL